MTNSEMQTALAVMLEEAAKLLKAKYPFGIRLQNDSATEDIAGLKRFTLTAFCDHGSYTVARPLALPTSLIEKNNVKGMVFHILYAIW